MTGQNKDGENQKAGEKADFYQGKTMEDAEKDFQNSQEDYLDTGHLKVLLLGKGLLDHEEAYKNLLHYLEEKPSVAGNIYVFSCSELGDVTVSYTHLDVYKRQVYSHKREQSGL